MRQRWAAAEMPGAAVTASPPSNAKGRQKEKRKTRPKAIVVVSGHHESDVIEITSSPAPPMQARRKAADASISTGTGNT